MHALLLLLAIARAHGPAPATLEVLRWDDRVGCEEVPAEATPRLVRTNIGLAEHLGDGTYAYVCPSRWGGSELVLAAAMDDEVVVADGLGAWWSRDGGCHGEPVTLPDGDVPVDVVRWRDGLWLLTRRFDRDEGALFRIVDGEADERARWDDFVPDAGLPSSDGLWLGGVTPAAMLRRWTPDGVVDRPLGEDAAEADRVTPRAARDGVVAAVVGFGADRRLWAVGDAAVVEVVAGAEVLHGPARVDGTWLVSADGMLVRADTLDTPFESTGTSVPWTCVQALDGVAYACGLDAVRRILDADGSVAPIVSLDQLGPPSADCDGVEGLCELDWFHEGGESGWLDTAPASCPLGERGEVSDTPVPEDCGCDGTGGAGVWWLAAFVGLRRRQTAR